MPDTEAYLKRYRLWLQVGLIFFATLFLSLHIDRPLADYDEATYAKVVVDTLEVGHFATFQLGERLWFEKPPLFLWLDMASVKVFGTDEFAFRLPAIALSVLCLWLVYLIVLVLTGSELAAALGFFVLLTSNVFFVFSREVRLDSGVLAAILAATWFWIRGWEDRRYLLWVLPAIAVGVLFKSVIAFLVLPIILILSLFYRRWAWLKSKQFWFGTILAACIVLPWHVYESIKFGHAFWSDYLGRQVVARATSTLTGINNSYDYVLNLWGNVPWIWALFVGVTWLIVLRFSVRFKEKVHLNGVLAHLCVVVFIITIFTLARTHLGPYILPAYAFLAICIALSFHQLTLLSTRYEELLQYVLGLLLIGATVVCAVLLSISFPPYTYEEKAIGQAYKSNPPAPLYALDWKVFETVNFYGDATISAISPTDGGRTLHAPFYLFVTLAAESYFFHDVNTPLFKGLKILYQGSAFALIYADQDLELPAFQCCNP